VEPIALSIFVIVGVGVAILLLVVLRALWMWLLGINELLAVLREIRDRLPEPAQRPAAPARSAPTLPATTNPLRR